MKTTHSRFTLTAALFFIVVIVGGCAAIPQKEEKAVGDESMATSTPLLENQKQYHQVETDEYFYDVVYNNDEEAASPNFYSNPQIVSTVKATGVKEVLLDDLEKITMPTHEREGYSVFSYSKEKNILYLASYIGETESIPTVTWKFDLTQKKLEPLTFKTDKNVSIAAESWMYIPNPNKLKLVRAVYKSEENVSNGFAQQLVIYDLEKETATLIAQLTGNETFNGGSYGLSEWIDARWLDENTIEYTVFDQSGWEEDSDVTKSILEKRKVRVAENPLYEKPDEVVMALIDFTPAAEEKDLIGCGAKVVYKSIEDQKSTTPLTSAFEELFSLPSKFTYLGKELLNPLAAEKVEESFKQPDGTVITKKALELKSASVENDTIKIHFTGDIKSYHCSLPNLQAQIEHTALQFPHINKLVISLNGKVLDWSQFDEKD